MKKLISWLLLCALLLSLAACGSSGQVVAPTSDSGDWGGRGQPFALKSVELPGQALGLAACGDALCVLVQGEARALYSVEDGQLVQLGYSEADGAAGRMTADDSGVWLTLIGADGSGPRLAHYPLDGGSADAYIEPDAQDCTRLAYGGGLIWLYDSALGRLLALKPDGTESLRLELDEPVYSLAPIENGTMAQSRETLLRCTANGVADAGACSGSIWSSDDGGWLETDADGLWHSTEAGREAVAIWAECGISLSDITALTPLDGSYALISGDALWLLEPAAPEDIEPRREVSVYCLDPGADDFLGPVLAAVNAAEPALYAYTLHDPDADMETRISTLAALYASGEGPELICLGGIDPLDYIGSGWFADIYDLMESQGGMSRDELVAPGPYELGGALYSLPAAFGISTMLGRESRFGQYCSLYAPDIIDLDSKISPDQVLSRDELYSLICTTLAAQLRLGELPEAESLTALLELAAEPRKTSEYIPPEEAFGADMVMLGYQYLYNARSLAEAEAAAGCELWPVGAPTADGACGSAARTLISWAVSPAYAENGDGWALLQALLRLPEANVFAETPMYRPLFEAQLQELSFPDEEFLPAVTERQRDCFLGLLDELELAAYTTSPLLDIVSEEGVALRAGAQTPEGAAQLILERAALYRSEHG